MPFFKYLRVADCLLVNHAQYFDKHFQIAYTNLCYVHELMATNLTINSSLVADFRCDQPVHKN